MNCSRRALGIVAVDVVWRSRYVSVRLAAEVLAASLYTNSVHSKKMSLTTAAKLLSKKQKICCKFFPDLIQEDRNSFWRITKKLWWIFVVLKSENLVVVCAELRSNPAQMAGRSGTEPPTFHSQDVANHREL
jgi:hypothetical protein